MEDKIKKCCICGREFVGYGNNPDGAAWMDQFGRPQLPEFKEDDVCCDECDGMYVVPGRIYRMRLRQEQAKKAKGEAKDGD